MSLKGLESRFRAKYLLLPALPIGHHRVTRSDTLWYFPNPRNLTKKVPKSEPWETFPRKSLPWQGNGRETAGKQQGNRQTSRDVESQIRKFRFRLSVILTI